VSKGRAALAVDAFAQTNRVRAVRVQAGFDMGVACAQLTIGAVARRAGIELDALIAQATSVRRLLETCSTATAIRSTSAACSPIVRYPSGGRLRSVTRAEIALEARRLTSTEVDVQC
jgi:hypothetical protein